MQDRIEVFRRIERQYFRDQLGPLGLQAAEAMIICLLRRRGRLRQEDIVHRIVLDKGTVARAVARLEKLGLVVRSVSDQCRREKLVDLTPAGVEMAARIQAVMDVWNDISYQGFTPEERDLYDSFLTRITDNVKQFKEGAGTNG